MAPDIWSSPDQSGLSAGILVSLLKPDFFPHSEIPSLLLPFSTSLCMAYIEIKKYRNLKQINTLLFQKHEV